MPAEDNFSDRFLMVGAFYGRAVLLVTVRESKRIFMGFFPSALVPHSLNFNLLEIFVQEVFEAFLPAARKDRRHDSLRIGVQRVEITRFRFNLRPDPAVVG